MVITPRLPWGPISLVTNQFINFAFLGLIFAAWRYSINVQLGDQCDSDDATCSNYRYQKKVNCCCWVGFPVKQVLESFSLLGRCDVSGGALLYHGRFHAVHHCLLGKKVKRYSILSLSQITTELIIFKPQRKTRFSFRHGRHDVMSHFASWQ